MNAERPDEEEIFTKAVEITSPQEQKAYLDKACGDDAELRAAVEDLLRLHETEQQFMEVPPVAVAPTIQVSPVSEKPGDVIGRYKLLEQIGEGGFGVVYMAEQTEPIRRRVALKIIKLGMETKTVIARFEAERQALALMDHPNIAKVLDAGATEAGRPYFVMELVKGIPITEYCDQAGLPTHERLGLFVQVCSAVQHAHQKGIIHRDLKPTNVLVTLHDGTPVPKIIDFGIAKAMDRPLTEKTVFTSFRQFIGTPHYMSPEQAVLSGLDIDTRSDVYALGVLLYELLTGSPPFDPETLRSLAYDEMCRVIRQEEPPPPSTRISTMGEKAAQVAQRRHTDPDALGRLVRGELDWIVMKALEKDRTRRYESASAFADDVRRHVEHQPVLAGPRGMLYRMRKSVRRNRVKVVAGLVVLVSLIVGLGIASFAMVQAYQQNRRALAAYRERDAEQARRQEAEHAAQRERQGAAEAGRRAESERQAKEREVAARREEHRWQLIAEAQDLMGQQRFDLALQTLQSAAAMKNDYATRLALWRLAEVYCDEPDQRIEGLSGRSVFSPDGRLIASVKSNELWLWKLGEGEPRRIGAHAAPIRGLAVSPDGRTTATSSQDRKVKLWDAGTGGELRAWEVPQAAGTLAFSPDGRLLASGSDGFDVMLWDVATGEHLRTLEWGNEISTVLFSPNGSRLYVDGAGGPLGVWDMASGRLLAAAHEETPGLSGEQFACHPGGGLLISGHSVNPTAVRFWQVPGLRECYSLTTWSEWMGSVVLSPDGRTLALASQEGDIRFWDLASRDYTGPTLGTDQSTLYLCYQPDGQALLSAGSGYRPEVCDLGQGTRARMRSLDPGIPLGFSPDGTLFAVTGRLELLLCDVSSGVIVERLQGERAWGPEQVAFSPEGSRVAVARTGKCVLWDFRTRARLEAPVRSKRVEFSPDGSVLAVGDDEGTVRILDGRTAALLHTLPGHDVSIPPAMAFSPDSCIVATAGGKVRLWDAATGAEAETLAEDRPAPAGLAFSPDGRYLGAANPGFAVWRIGTGTELKELSAACPSATSFAFGPDGHSIAVGTREGPVHLWNLDSRTEEAVLEGHSGSVGNLAFSPDGKMLASTAQDSTARLWDVASAREVKRMKLAAPAGQEALEFTRDGRVLVASGLPAEGKLWKMPPPSALRRAGGDSGGIFSVAVSPDGKTVVSGNGSGFIRLWDRQTGELIRAQRGHDGWVRTVAFSPDGQTIASIGLEGGLKLWDASSGFPLWEAKCAEPGSDLAFSPDGSAIATSGFGSGKLQLWDAATGEVRWTEDKPFARGSGSGVAFSPDGRYLVTAHWHCQYCIWDAADGKLQYALVPGEGALELVPATDVPVRWRKDRPVWGPAIHVSTFPGAKAVMYGDDESDFMAFCPDAGLLALGEPDRTVKLWDLASRAEVMSVAAPATCTACLALSPDGSRMLWRDAKGDMKICDSGSGSEVAALTGHEGIVATAAFSPDGRSVYSGSPEDWTLREWDAATGRQVHTLATRAERILSVTYSPDGRLLATSGYHGTLALRDAATLEVVRSLQGHTGIMTGAAFSPDGRSLASTGADGTVRVWDAATGAGLRTLKVGTVGVWSPQFSPDGRLLAFSSDDGLVRVLDASTWEQLRELTGHLGPVIDVAWSPDGKLLASGGREGAIRLWDAEDGAEAGLLLGHESAVWPVIFSPDGGLLASGGSDGHIRVWDMAAHRALRDLPAHQDRVRSLAFSPDGKVLASASYDNTLKLWDTKGWAEILELPVTPDSDPVDDILSVAFSPDGASLAVARNTDLLVYDLRAHQDAVDRWIGAAGAQVAGKEVAGAD